MDTQKMLMVTAYPSDGLIHCGGTLMKYAEEGHTIHLLVLTDGLHRKTARPVQPASQQDIQQRHEYFTGLYSGLGVACVEFLGLDDCPLSVDNAVCEQLAVKIRSFRPDFIVTHAREKDLDELNYTAAAKIVVQAYAIASAAGAFCQGLPVSPRQTPMFGIEPFRAENCGWTPGIMLDITAYEAQKESLLSSLNQEQISVHLIQQRARARGVHSSGRGGKASCKYAEAFSCYGPIYAHQHFVW